MTEAGIFRRLTSDAMFVYFGYFLRYLSLIVLIPYYGRVLGPTHYGTLLSAMSVMSIVWMVVNYGFSPDGTRQLARENSEEKLINLIFTRQFFSRIVMIPIGVAVGVIATYFSPILSSNILFGVLATILGLINSFNLGWFYQGLRWFRISIAFEALAYPLNILFILGLVRSENDGALALIGLLLSSLICTAAAYLYAFRKVRFESIQAIEILKEIRGSSVIFLQSANATIITVGSTLLLSIYCNSEQVGYYGSVERLVSFAIAMLAPAAQVLMPTIAYFQSNAHLNANKLIAVGIALEVSYGFFIAIVCTLFSSIIINHVFGEGFQKSISIFKVFVWIMPFASLNHAIGMYALLPQNREKLLVYAVLLGNVVAIILVPVLTPALGSMGMVISRISCEAFAASILSVCWFVLPRKKLRTF